MFDTLAEDQNQIWSILKGEEAENAPKEKLFGLVFDLFQASNGNASRQQIEMCEDVLTQLIGLVELEARIRISERLAELEDAPRRVLQYLAVEPIQVAQPVLCKSPVLQDEDLLMVSRLCGSNHLEAIAERKEVSSLVTTELMRLGNEQVWERLSQNNGADLSDKSVAFLVNRARENPKIQMGLIDRPDLPQKVVSKIVSEAGESLRHHLTQSGRQDLLAHLDRAKAVAQKRVLSTSSILGYEYEAAYQDILRLEQVQPLVVDDLLQATEINDFPRTCAIFARLADLALEDAVHWLSRREVDPAIVAFKALGFHESLVYSLLKTGPWKRILTENTRQRALKAFGNLKPEVAQRIFLARSSATGLQRAKV